MGDLTTLAVVKEQHGISGSSYDTLITTVIAGVSIAMERYVGRTLTEATYSDELYSGDGFTDQIVLRNWPVTDTVTFVLKEDNSTITSTNYSVHSDSGIVYPVPDYYGQAVWTAGRWNYAITYSAGYDSTTMPADIAMAATDQVRHQLNQIQPTGPNWLGKTGINEATGFSVTLAPHRLLDSVKEILNTYRRRF